MRSFLCAIPILQLFLPCAMAAKFTTLAYLPLKDDNNLSSALKLVKGINGVSQVYYGRRVEDSTVVDVGIDWSSNANTSKLNQLLAAGGDINKLLSQSLTSAPQVVTMQHSSGPGTLLDAAHNPFVEIATFYFLPGVTDAQLKEFDSDFKGLEDAVKNQTTQTLADAGHVVGDLPNPSIGANVKAFIAAVGWQSVAAHNAFAQTPLFASTLGALVPFLSGNADHHVQFKKV